MIIKRLMLAILVAIGLGGSIRAAPTCSVPASVPVPHAETASAREPSRTLPVGSYTLAMIWLPEECRSRSTSFDCSARAGKAGLVLHGLWPDGRGRTWPQWCTPAAILPRATLAAHYCATPSAQLIQHEWAKHGTCMAGMTPERYLALSRALFERFRAPDLRALSYRRPTGIEIRKSIAAANPGITADMVRLDVSRSGWLREVWLCLDTGFHPTRCAIEAKATKATKATDGVSIWRGLGRGAGARGGYGRRG